MANFTQLLISLCTIQGKTLSTTGYTQTPTWANLFTNVACRKDSSTGSHISDDQLRDNIDDDIFFFNPDTVILRGNRIVFDGDNYDVIKVAKIYDSVGIHHLEVVCRITDHD